ncbi:MAG TPA: hypothetical protein VE736_08450 [Gaiellaceae bacterium]|jgi:hypothetical protein|nr:hypothetical protein [Gaiellaceae bacterium]
MKPLLVLLLLSSALALTACGSSKKNAQTSSLPQVLPTATTPNEWAKRVVNLLLRPLNRDLQIVNGFNDPNVIVYIANQNPTTLRIIRKRLGDLSQCSNKLVTIGPPPAARRPLKRVNTQLRKACTTYVQLAADLQKATLFISSGRSDVIARGRKMLLEARPTNNTAAQQFEAAIRSAQVLPEFHRAGLQPSV